MRLYNSDREEYLDTLPAEYKLAHVRVQLFLAAVGKQFRSQGDCPPMQTREMHHLFPIFAKEMGYEGEPYLSIDDLCPAITILYPDTDDSFWMITPMLHYMRLTTRSRERVDGCKPALDAALVVCRVWLPNWRWPEQTT